MAHSTDPDLRRRLWREWIHTDAPATPSAAQRTSSSIAPSDWLPEAIDAPRAVIAGLVTAVRESLVGNQLPYGDRKRLIAGACRLGLNRFEANLLIAAVIHRVPKSRNISIPSPHRIFPSVFWMVLTLTAIEAAAVAVVVARHF